MAIKTLRARLTLRYVAVLAATLILFTGLLYVALSRALYRHHDAELAEAATQLQRILRNVPLDEAAIDRALNSSRDFDSLVMVRDQSGTLRYRSAVLTVSEPNIGLHEALVHAAAHGEAAPQFFTTTLERSGTTRFICVPAATKPSGYVQIGRPLGDVAPALDTFRDASLIVLPLVILLTSYGGWLLAGRALAPVKEIDRTLQAIQASDLSSRVSVRTGDAELHHLATTVNQTLDRLEAAFVSLREFLADVSHQLQTPLAVMKSSIEVAAKDPALSAQTLDEQLTGSINDMSSMLADLQALALADADLASNRSAAVDFSGVCVDAVEIVSALAEASGISVDSTIAPDIHIWGDAVSLLQVVLNLGDNAIKYTMTGGRVHISLSSRDSRAVLTIADSGRGIDAHQLPHIFDRFFRAQGHPSDKPGSGLGLAIAKRIVEVHHGSIAVTSEPGKGTTFTIELPLSKT